MLAHSAVWGQSLYIKTMGAHFGCTVVTVGAGKVGGVEWWLEVVVV